MIFGNNLRFNLGYQKSISKKFCFFGDHLRFSLGLGM